MYWLTCPWSDICSPETVYSSVGSKCR